LEVPSSRLPEEAELIHPEEAELIHPEEAELHHPEEDPMLQHPEEDRHDVTHNGVCQFNNQHPRDDQSAGLRDEQEQAEASKDRPESEHNLRSQERPERPEEQLEDARPHVLLTLDHPWQPVQAREEPQRAQQLQRAQGQVHQQRPSQSLSRQDCRERLLLPRPKTIT